MTWHLLVAWWSTSNNSFGCLLLASSLLNIFFSCLGCKVALTGLLTQWSLLLKLLMSASIAVLSPAPAIHGWSAFRGWRSLGCTHPGDPSSSAAATQDRRQREDHQPEAGRSQTGSAIVFPDGGYLERAHPQISLGHLTAVDTPSRSIAEKEHFKMQPLLG